MFQRIKEKILEYCDYPEDKINENTEIINDLQISSLDIMLMIGDIENEYKINFSQDDIKDIITVGDFVNMLQSKINK